MGYMAVVCAVLSIETDGGWQAFFIGASLILAALCWIAGLA